MFSVELDQVETCFSLPSEPRAFALVYRRDSADGYCCASLMLNDALTSLTVSMMVDWQSITVSCVYIILYTGLGSLGDAGSQTDELCHQGEY